MADNGINIAFVRTSVVLAAANLRRQSGVVMAILLLFSGWLVWLVVGRVSVYAVSRTARIESTLPPLPVQPAVDGTVVECSVALGQQVREGEVLVRLDSHLFELQRAEAQADLDANVAAIASLQAEVDAQQKARAALADLADITARAGRARVNVSQTTAKYKEQESDVVQKLSDSELASKLDQIRANEQRATNRAEVSATSTQAARDTSTGRASVLDRDAQIASLQKALVDTQMHVEVLRAHVGSLQYEIERRNVRAAAKGTLADIISCSPGMTVTTQQRLATILPDTPMRVVSMFVPEDAVGRVQAGQQATMRIDNFPWTQFGTVGAVVDRVGSEPRDGLVRVELRIDKPNPAIPIVDGVTASVEVEVEKISPLHLLLRTAGQWIKPANEPIPNSPRR